MSPTVWRPELELGVPWQDRRHRYLAQLIDSALQTEATYVARLANRLELLHRFCEGHFHEEEGHMVRSGYPDEVEHRFQHDHLLHELEQYVKRLRTGRTWDRDELSNFLTLWYTRHVDQMDRDFAQFLRRRNHPVASDPDSSLVIEAPEELVARQG